MWTTSAASTRCCSPTATRTISAGCRYCRRSAIRRSSRPRSPAKRLPAGTKVNPLPIKGRGDVLGIPVDTGRNGHAPGGIWMRFHGGTGLLYTGDYSTKSALYAFDPLPKSRTMLFDCSYGEDDTPLAERQKVLAPYLAGDVLLPAPADGRGPDIALHLSPRRQDDPLRRRDPRRGARSDRQRARIPARRRRVRSQRACRKGAAARRTVRRDLLDARRRLRRRHREAVRAVGEQAAAGDRVHRLHPAGLARRSAGESRPREIPALERAPAAVRHLDHGAHDRRGDGDPRVLRQQIPAGAAGGAQARERDDG